MFLELRQKINSALRTGKTYNIERVQKLLLILYLGIIPVALRDHMGYQGLNLSWPYAMQVTTQTLFCLLFLTVK